jgi:hypothetical protein
MTGERTVRFNLLSILKPIGGVTTDHRHKRNISLIRIAGRSSG